MNVNEWVCVPREATEMMRNWGVTAWNFNVSTPKNVYEAMLAAAPTPAPVPVDTATLEAAANSIEAFVSLRRRERGDQNAYGDDLEIVAKLRAALAANGEKGT